MVVDAGKREIALPCRLTGHRLGRQPFDRSAGVDDGLRLLHVGPEAAALRLDVHAVAKPWPPFDRRVQRRVAVGDLHGERQDVGLRIDPEHLLRAQPVAAVELEGHSRRSRRRVDRAGSRRVVQRGVESRALGLVGHTQRERARRVGRKPRRHQIDRLTGLIEISRQLPALDDPAAVAESRAHRAGLDDDVALGAVSDQRLRCRKRRRCVQRRGRVRRAGRRRGRCSRTCRLRDRCWRRPGHRPLGLRHDGLVRVEHQEREEDGNQNTLFHEHLTTKGPKRSRTAGVAAQGRSQTPQRGGSEPADAPLATRPRPGRGRAARRRHRSSRTDEIDKPP